MAFRVSERDPSRDIVLRLLELYDSTDDLKSVFNAFFTADSAIRNMLEIDSMNDKETVGKTLVGYLGPNFLRATVGKNYNDKKKNGGTYLIRHELLKQICKNHANPSEKEDEIVKTFNNILKTRHETFYSLVRDSRFMAKKESRLELMKVLRFPDIVFESPPKINREEETTTVNKKSPLKPLYDYQTQTVFRISEMLSQEDVAKRILVSVPTGAGKTRLTVEALVDWIGRRNTDKIPKASLQQKNGRIIFWFASTNELCAQAASEFVNIYSQIGIGGEPFNVTRLYGDKRRDLFQILEDHPGTHIVVTNTEHFQDQLRSEKDASQKFSVDQYWGSNLFDSIRKQTIAIVIDEAHEAMSDTYRRFLAAMGFDFSGRKIASECNYNRCSIVLIGLTATPYRGSGRRVEDSGETDDLDVFAKPDADNDPPYLARLDPDTRKIHKMFGRVYVPLPKMGHRNSAPVSIIEAPTYAHSNERVKISGLKSFDNFSDVSYLWEIETFGGKTASYKEGSFYHLFSQSGDYIIKLTVTNKHGEKDTETRQITVYADDSSTGNRSNLEDNEEFNKVLQERKIVCKVVYGIIDGPQLEWNENEIRRWRRGNLSERNEEIIENDNKYNQLICDIVDKAVCKYGRKRVLIFANGVNHAHNLALILRVRYKLNARSVDGQMNSGLRRKTIHEFRNGEINILCNHGILTSGFDVPEIDTLLICRTVGSDALYTQMIGRGQRGTISGGTEDLWLITAYFKKGAFEDGVRLGWEAMASSWAKFPNHIKADLKIRDNTETPDPHMTVRTQQKSTTRTLVCMTCGISASEEDLPRVFGVQKAQNNTHMALLDSTLPKNCHTCRKIKSIAEKTECKFCKVLANVHKYDPVMVAVAMFAKKRQGDPTPARVPHLQSYTHDQIRLKIPPNQLSPSSKAVRRAESARLMTVMENLDLQFMHIEDVQCLDRIVSKIVSAPQYESNMEKLVKDTESLTDVNAVDHLGEIFNELQIRYGHTPTTRQFAAGVSANGLDNEFAEIYGSDYDKFLQDRRVILRDDLGLKDALYEEYFEKCVEVGEQITRGQLDEHGKYRISDYEEVFGSFKSFQQTAKHDLAKLLEASSEVDEDVEFDRIDEDLSMLQKKISATPHFDVIRIHSRLGAHRYLAQIQISNLRYLEKYRGSGPGKFLRMVTEFFRIKRILGVAPTPEQFMSCTTVYTKSAFGALFEFRYRDFLAMLGEEAVDQDNTAHSDKMRKDVLTKLRLMRDEYGLSKTNKTIDMAVNMYDTLSVSIKAWWPDTKKLKRAIATTPNTAP